MHPIEKYPELIETAQIELLALSTQIAQTGSLQIKTAEAIDIRVAFDETLKNDTQRKAKRAELLTEHPDYKYLESGLQSTIFSHKKKQIEVERLVNEFTYLKIKMKEEIVFFENISNTHVLPGT